MKKLPTAQPVTMAIAVHRRLMWSAMPVAPIASVARLTSPVNQIGDKCHTLPCRSASGT
jgi:hypothetical protein